MSIFFYMSFIPVVLGIALAGLVIYWDHKRDMALIEKELYQPLSQVQRLRAWGLVVTGIGMAFFIGSFWVGLPEIELGGLVVTFIGLALLIFSAITRRGKLP